MIFIEQAATAAVKWARKYVKEVEFEGKQACNCLLDVINQVEGSSSVIRLEYYLGFRSYVLV